MQKKMLLFGGYNPYKRTIGAFLSGLGKILDHHTCNIEDFILLRDSNSEVNEQIFQEFRETDNLKNPSSIDVILTNKARSFHNTIRVESRLPDYHKI